VDRQAHWRMQWLATASFSAGSTRFLCNQCSDHGPLKGRDGCVADGRRAPGDEGLDCCGLGHRVTRHGVVEMVVETEFAMRGCVIV